ncbi:MAG: alanine--tRNA ligase [Saccharofermentanales bacterium]|jgi:alanyl-tRNA synthetase
MQPIGLNQIREMFLSFFEERDHLRMPSFSLVPENDPSILLINAGMTPLKPYFTGAKVPPHPRVTTCQKCIRTPDIERVGKTSRHGTFFEMLGNFSFGDYFKAEIIPWSWEFCTQTLKIPEEKLSVTVFEEDDEAWQIWHDAVGLPPEKIFRLGKEDNFWEHGIGPCGPCSEIYYDHGPDRGCGKPDCQVGCDCDRYVEFWNLVFTQFNREEDGSYTPLARKNIDTGAGLERLACIMQGVDNLFEVDTIRAILDYTCTIAGADYGRDDNTDTAIRVIADHIRSTVMMVGDGIIPSNEGRGYVLRRLLRRAARYGRLLGIDGTFLHDIARIVIREASTAYPELVDRQEYLMRIIRTEEERFAGTIQQGIAILESYLEAARAEKRDRLSGQEVFRLHDTYGFPLDLTREMAAEQGFAIDEEGFETEMNRQKEQARQALRDKAGSAWTQDALPEELDSLAATLFIGYEKISDQGRVLAILIDQGEAGRILADRAEAGQQIRLITDRTPFYAAAGGQVGDVGLMTSRQVRISVKDTIATPEGLVLHTALVEKGVVKKGDLLDLRVDSAVRLSTARNHTVTHLLHQALRQVLGKHVTQAGSSVTPDRFRFDFSHYQPLTSEEKAAVEQIVNQAILDNLPVSTEIMSLVEARQSGVMALFDEKYSDEVRVVRVGDFSQELCGGTHLSRSSEACLFHLLSEGGVAAGVRRIEGITGQKAWERVRKQDQLLQTATQLLKVQAGDMPDRIRQILDQTRRLEKELTAEKNRLLTDVVGDLVETAEEVEGLKLVTAEVQVDDLDRLREMADGVRSRLGSGLVVLAAVVDEKVALVIMAAPDAVARGIHAGRLIKEAARVTGGGGGGRPDMAQAGGRDRTKIAEALQTAQESVRRQLSQ